MARFLRHVAYWFAAFALGAAAKERSDVRRAQNPLLESAWTGIKFVLVIELLVWLLMFQGAHTVYMWFDSLMN
jgi:hypothetical protein